MKQRAEPPAVMTIDDLSASLQVHPHLRLMIDLLVELEPESRFIHIHRPIDESISSLVDRSAEARGWLQRTPEQCERLQRAMRESKTEGWSAMLEWLMFTVLDPKLLADPEIQTQRAIVFLTLRISAEQREQACELVVF